LDNGIKKIHLKVDDRNPKHHYLNGYLQEAIDKIESPRKLSPNKQYSLFDAALGAFGVFFFQCSSFLEHQKQLNSRKRRDNTQTLLDV
jgi:hypothetical protein